MPEGGREDPEGWKQLPEGGGQELEGGVFQGFQTTGAERQKSGQVP